MSLIKSAMKLTRNDLIRGRRGLEEDIAELKQSLNNLSGTKHADGFTKEQTKQFNDLVNIILKNNKMNEQEALMFYDLRNKIEKMSANAQADAGFQFGLAQNIAGLRKILIEDRFNFELRNKVAREIEALAKAQGVRMNRIDVKKLGDSQRDIDSLISTFAANNSKMDYRRLQRHSDISVYKRREARDLDQMRMGNTSFKEAFLKNPGRISTTELRRGGLDALLSAGGLGQLNDLLGLSERIGNVGGVASARLKQRMFSKKDPVKALLEGEDKTTKKIDKLTQVTEDKIEEVADGQTKIINNQARQIKLEERMVSELDRLGVHANRPPRGGQSGFRPSNAVAANGGGLMDAAQGYVGGKVLGKILPKLGPLGKALGVLGVGSLAGGAEGLLGAELATSASLLTGSGAGAAAGATTAAKSSGVLSKILGVGARGAGKLALPLTAIMAAKDGWDGWDDAKATDLYGDNSFGSKTASSLTSIASGLALGLVDEKSIANFFRSKPGSGPSPRYGTQPPPTSLQMRELEQSNNLNRNIDKLTREVDQLGNVIGASARGASGSFGGSVGIEGFGGGSGASGFMSGGGGGGSSLNPSIGRAGSRGRSSGGSSGGSSGSSASSYVSGVTSPFADLKAGSGEHLGGLSSKYEGKVGTAGGDGGRAYGKYQFDYTVGGLQKFFAHNPEYAKKFEGLQPGTPEFDQKWRDVAKEDPKGFEAAQNKTAKSQWYDPAAATASKLGFNLGSRGVQEAIFSGAIQHGGINKILESAAATPGFKNMSPEDQIKAFYSARRNYVSGLNTLDPGRKESVLRRYDEEEKNALTYHSSKKAVTDAATDANTSALQSNLQFGLSNDPMKSIKAQNIRDGIGGRDGNGDQYKTLNYSSSRVEGQASALSTTTRSAAQRLKAAYGDYTITSTTGGRHSVGSAHYTHNNPTGEGGQAIDVRIKDLSTEQRMKLVEDAKRAGFTRIGISGTHLHLDTKPTDNGKTMVFDEGGGVSAFGGRSKAEWAKHLEGINTDSTLSAKINPNSANPTEKSFFQQAEESSPGASKSLGGLVKFGRGSGGLAPISVNPTGGIGGVSQGLAPISVSPVPASVPPAPAAPAAVTPTDVQSGGGGNGGQATPSSGDSGRKDTSDRSAFVDDMGLSFINQTLFG